MRSTAKNLPRKSPAAEILRDAQEDIPPPGLPTVVAHTSPRPKNTARWAVEHTSKWLDSHASRGHDLDRRASHDRTGLRDLLGTRPRRLGIACRRIELLAEE